MFDVLSRFVFSTAIISQLLVIGSLSFNTATAATRCNLRTLIEEGSAVANSRGFQVSKLDGVEKIKLKAATIKELKKIFEKYEWELSATKINEVIEGAANLIKGNSRTPSIEHSNKMAEIGREILKTASGDLNVAQKKLVIYMIAESVLRLESMKITEFKDENLPVFNKKSTVHLNKVHDLVESYVDGTTGYADLPRDGGFLSWIEVRGLYANNSWAIGLRNHDMYHLHYSYGHPYYFAVNMHSARSINDRRYAMTSTLWESIDVFRTSYENAIAQHFRNKNMSPEEAMLFLGSATEKELDQLDSEVGSYTQLNSLSELSYSGGWRPVKTKFGRNTTGYNEATFVKELADFINTSIEKLKVGANRKYANYHRSGPGVVGAADENMIP